VIVTPNPTVPKPAHSVANLLYFTHSS